MRIKDIPSYPFQLFRAGAVNNESLNRRRQFPKSLIERQQSDVHFFGGPGLRYDPFVGQRGPVGGRYLRFPSRPVPNGTSCRKTGKAFI